MFALLSRYWWVLVVRGAMAIVLGIFAFVWPQETIAALVLIFGAIALVDGTLAVVASIAGRSLTPYWWVLLLQVAAAVTLRREISGEWWLALGGLQAFGALGIVLGPVTFAAAAAIVDVLRETEGGDRTNVSTHASVD